MLEHLFSSRTRVKLLKKFLLNPQENYYVRELTRDIGERINSVRRELENLSKLGLLITFNQNQKKYYQVNTDFLLYSELTSLLTKAQSLLEDKIVDRLRKIANIKYCILTGRFVQNDEVQTDILIVGNKLNQTKVKDAIRRLEKHFDQEINYTVMTTQEFGHRSEMTDRFLYNIINSPKITVVDKIFSTKK